MENVMKDKVKKVFVSGCFDLLHSGHIAFFEEAASYGDVYVSIGSDSVVKELKGHYPICSEDERCYMVAALRSVKEVFVGSGSGYMDFIPELYKVKPDIFFVNSDGDKPEKSELCEEMGIEYIVSRRHPKGELPWRSSSIFREIFNKK